MKINRASQRVFGRRGKKLFARRCRGGNYNIYARV
jgi:hypothetical protein